MEANRRNLLFSILVITAIALGCKDITHKSDAEMISHFHENRDGFERLLQMIREDEQKLGKTLFRIDEDWTHPENLSEYSVSAERVRNYRKIFRELAIPRGFYAFGEGDFYRFVASAQGISVSGSSKGFVRSSKPPASLIHGDLDTYHRETVNPNDFIFRPIEGNWYLVRVQ